jgi:hypothetical protein
MIAASTRRRVSLETSERPLMTFETVGTETPVCSAMKAIVIAGSVGCGGPGVLAMDEVYRKLRPDDLLCAQARASMARLAEATWPARPCRRVLTLVRRLRIVSVETISDHVW